jgi:hypothetical protein
LRAVAKPIPLLPPVITATFPANLVMVRPPLKIVVQCCTIHT